MLKRFEATNVKGFKNRIVFDLSARDYNFNSSIVKNGIVNKALIYGKNGTGKTSLCIAIMDIISHLTEKERMKQKYISNMRNLESDNIEMQFHYFFDFDGDEVDYRYGKLSQEELTYETLLVNGQCVVDYRYGEGAKKFIDPSFSQGITIDFDDNRLSVLKYIYRSTPKEKNVILNKMIQYCENMLWYRSLSDGNTYSGFSNGSTTLVDVIYENNKVKDLQKFLRLNGINYQLAIEEKNGKKELLVVFKNGNTIPFNSVASSGTSALYLFFVWSVLAFSKASLVIIDEFDAFLHYEAAENMVKTLNRQKSFQTILTTHNTYLMKNTLTRPDACYILSNNHANNLFNCTDKEIREAHNLEKMYIGGAFTE